MRLSTAYRYKFLKDYRIGVPELLSETSYSGNIIFNESDARKSLGWLGDTQFVQIGNTLAGLASNDRNGWEVSINAAGDVIAIGAYLGRANDVGYTRIFALTSSSGNGSWGQIGQTIDGEFANDQSGFSVSLNNLGNRVAIGAIFNDGNGLNNSGHVRVYELSTFNNNNSWVKLGQDIDGEVTADSFGYQIKLNGNGNILAASSILNEDNGYRSGHVRVYELSTFNNNNSWVKLGQDINGIEGDRCGSGISLNNAGNRMAVSYPYRTVNGEDLSGIVKVFSLSSYNDNNSWVQIGQDITNIPNYSNYLGLIAVSLNYSGDRVTIGAPNATIEGKDFCGFVCAYELSGNNWVQIGQNINGKDAGDHFGARVSCNANGDKIAIISQFGKGYNPPTSNLQLYQLSSYNGANSWVKIGLNLEPRVVSGELAAVAMNHAGDIFITGGPVASAPGFPLARGIARVYKTLPQRTDNLYTSYNDDSILASRPIWKYSNNLNIYGGWYNNNTNSFLSDLQNLTFTVAESSNLFTEVPNQTAINTPNGFKWIEIATKKNTNITLSAIQPSAIYFKKYGFPIRNITLPQVCWEYNSNIYKDTGIGYYANSAVYIPDMVINNTFCSVVPVNTTISAFNLNYDNLFNNFSSEIQPISGVDRWLINNNQYVNSNTITLTSNDQYVLYQPLGISYKNITPVSATSQNIVFANSNILDFGTKSMTSLRSRLTSVTPLTSTRNVFTTYNRTTNTFIRNPNLWCADLTDQLTSLVVQKLGASIFSYGGTLITPRHLLYVQHAFPRTERVRFVRSDNTVVSAAPLSSIDSNTYKNDFEIASLSSIDPSFYNDIGIVLLDRDVSLSGIHVMPVAAITPTEKNILQRQFIPTLLCTQAPGRSTGSTNPNPLSASDIQMTINSTNYNNMNTAWGSSSANPFYDWDVMGGGYKLWDGDSGNSHLLFCNNKLYVYSTTQFPTGAGAAVAALSGIINHLIAKVDQLAGVNTGMRPTYYTIEQIANR